MPVSLLFKKPLQRILLITLRFLGDTLLTTPLLNSLRAGYPDAEIDVLVFKNTAAILEGNPAISHIITIAQKPTWQENQALFKRLFRQYDLAISTQTGDRPTLYACLASKIRIGFVPPKPQTGWFKRYFLTHWLEFDVQKTHTVLELLRLCQLLNIAPVYQLTAPPSDLPGFKNLEGLTRNYAVLHVFPQWRYKQWTHDGWVAIAQYLQTQGLQVVLSGSALPQEMAYLRDLQTELPANTLNVAGQLSLAQLAQVIENATVFVGVDTGITHLAAATGIPTVALFGPTDPVKWTPWPAHYESNRPPFVTKGDQAVNNSFLIQGDKSCVPCYFEGCDRHPHSRSACLDDLKPARVIAVLAAILKRRN
jgi:heptosyltransferase-3